MLVLCGPARAQDTGRRFLHFSAQEGLSQNSVHCIFRDRSGMVWIGTQDGLNSFDGKKFTVYRPVDGDSTSISDQFIITINEDDAGFLWIGTRYGLNRLDKRTGKFQRFFFDEQEKKQFQASYSEIFFLPGNKLLTNCSAGAVLFSPGQAPPRKLHTSAFARALVDKTGAILLFHDTDGVFSITGEGHKDIRRVAPSFASLFQSRHLLFCNSNGSISLFVSSTERTRIFRFDHQRAIWLPPLEPGSRVYHAIYSGGDTLIAATATGIRSYVGNHLIEELQNNPGNPGSLPPGSILSVYRDEQGLLWAGTSGSGFVMHSAAFDRFSLINTPVRNDVIQAVVESRDKVLAGGYAGLYQLKDDVLTIIPGWNNHKITALTATHDGHYWIAGPGGLWRLDPLLRTTGHWHTGNSPLISNLIFSIVTDQKGRLIIASERGGFLFDHSLNHWQTLWNKEAYNYVMHSFIDNRQQTWLGGNLGIVRFDSLYRQTFSMQSAEEGASPIARTLVTGITQTRTGDTWIATISRGIYRMRNNRIINHYSWADGLGSDAVYKIIADKEDRIWAATSSGLYVWNEPGAFFFRLTTFDGLPRGYSSGGCLYAGPSGKVYAGIDGALMITDPAKLKPEHQPVRAVIADIRVDGQSVAALDHSLTIHQGHRTVSVELATDQPFQLSTIFFQYRLLGFDNTWQTLPAGSNIITYTNLPYGKMTLEVKAARTVNGLKTASVTTFRVHAVIPFWQTRWFTYGCILLALLLTAGSMHLYNKNRIRRKNRELLAQQQVQQERDRIGRDLHDNIGAYTSALIAGLNRLDPVSEKQLQQKEELSNYAANIMGYLRETIWILHHQHLTLTAFVNRFRNYAYKIASHYPDLSIRVEEDITVDTDMQPQVLLNCFRVLQEALQNACKHARASVIVIRVTRQDHIILEVKDNGTGLASPKTEDSYGLTNMRQRAAEIGYELAIVSQPGSGTAVRLTENTTYAATALRDKK